PDALRRIHRLDANVSGATPASVHWPSAVHSSGRACLASDDSGLSADGQVLSSESAMGAGAAVCRHLLYGRNSPFSIQFLVRSRGRVEGKNAGFLNLSRIPQSG